MTVKGLFLNIISFSWKTNPKNLLSAELRYNGTRGDSNQNLFLSSPFRILHFYTKEKTGTHIRLAVCLFACLPVCLSLFVLVSSIMKFKILFGVVGYWSWKCAQHLLFFMHKAFNIPFSFYRNYVCNINRRLLC